MHTFLGLTVMGICLLVAIFNRDTIANLGAGAWVLGVLAVGGFLYFFFRKTDAGKDTAKDYKDGALKAKKAADHAVEDVKEAVEDAKEDLGKLATTITAKAETLRKKTSK